MTRPRVPRPNGILLAPPGASTSLATASQAQVSSSSTILIRGLQARCIIGANPWERRRRQKVLLDLAIATDTAAAEASDDLAQALDYKRVKNEVRLLVEQSRFHLLEALAGAVADHVLADARVTAVEVTLDKPGALSGARSVAIYLVRRRGGAQP